MSYEKHSYGHLRKALLELENPSAGSGGLSSRYGSASGKGVLSLLAKHPGLFARGLSLTAFRCAPGNGLFFSVLEGLTAVAEKREGNRALQRVCIGGAKPRATNDHN